MFSAIEKSSTRPRRWRSSGMWPRPRVEVLARRRAVTSVARDARSGPLVGAAEAGDRVDQLGLAVAVDAGDADDLACAHLERDAAHLLEAAVVAARRVRRPRGSGSPGVAGRFSTRRSTSRPTMSRARLSSVAPARGSVSIILPAPQHGDPVGDLEHLVQLVGDEDDRHPLAREAPQDREELRAPPAA